MSSALAFITALTLLLMSSQTMSASSSSGQKPEASSLQGPQLQDLMSEDDARLLKRSLREELQQHFELLQEAEENILQKIEALRAQRQAISQRKRSHYMCLVNIVACYK
uniref:Allatostatin-C n=1 Tax=Charonia tritonis TaxID=1960912 RepID=A0A1S6JQ02_9CAEN|nr:allatostatin-C precursor [Charonia tritonis]